MADTPRVTVPVEPTEAMLTAAWDSMPSGSIDADTRGVWSAMLSAAPAPEVGAVWTGSGDYEPTDAMIDAGEYHNHRHNPLTNMVASFKAMMDRAEIDGLISCEPALATREEAPDWTARTEAAWAENNRQEAPVEAGEPSLVDWFSQFIDNYVEETNGADGEALIACLDRVRDSYRQHALRAQPPAREDAQPVIWEPEWTRTGTDVDGDPIQLKTRWGEFTGRATLARGGDRKWGAHINYGGGKLFDHGTSEDTVKAWLEAEIRRRVSLEVARANTALALYTRPALQAEQGAE